ncbi:hypothetical protein FF1_036856 [Malus domestica]
MVERLGAEGFTKELSNGFRLLKDGERRDHIRELEEKLCIVGVAWDDEELRCMLREGDLDGDGSLNEMGFCTLMFRLSPALMETSKDFLEEALACDF